ncbi:JAB domain-containing protein [Maribacter polysaccharolyticus]|uniref:JAB domain-containing protein n=1 Tax=Maribacter polysaccharolyticus TaxID=3020831 RepID=UPI00237F2EC1|nr:JAB domain-containing protein [Maribacter polysaccharolyticus]MDE3744063.1 JAB domain-containing protein [Maribacter polysaccharolyticus]
MKDVRIRTYRDFVGELTAVYKRTELPTFFVKSSRDAAHYMRPHFDECMDDHEEVKVMHLSRSNGVVNIHHVTSGSETGCIVPIKDIMRQALIIKTCNIILFHSHPSGNLKFSQADISVSKKLKEAGELLEIKVLDSIVLTREGYLSRADESLF